MSRVGRLVGCVGLGIGLVAGPAWVAAAALPPAAASASGRMVPGLPGVVISPDEKVLTSIGPFGQAHRQPNHSYRALFTPNDPQFGLQWHLPDIGMPAAWDHDQTTPKYGGDPSVVVAVLDTGASYENFGSFKRAPDLAQTRFWSNPGEAAGDGQDNDGNGFVDDVRGWDFVNDDAHPNDDHGHGTHVAGTIAGSTDNALATAGIAFQTSLMPLKVLNKNGIGTTVTIAAAIAYATDQGADIINLSLGSDQDDPILHQVIQAAVAQGVIIVAAAGNDGSSSINYPARYSEVVAVGAVQYDLTRAPYSDYGPALDLVAPGGNLDLDQNGDGQPDGILQQTCTSSACTAFASYYYSGTSQAAAQVSAVAALLGACGAPAGTIVGSLKSTAVDLGAAGRDNLYGYGLIDAAAALSAAGCRSGSPLPPGAIAGRSSETTSRTLFQHEAYPYRQPVFTWSGPTGATYRVSWGRIGQAGVQLIQTVARFSPRLTDEGAYQLEVESINQRGQVSEARSFTYRYRRPVFMVGQSSATLGIRLYRPDPSLIRSWPGGLGDVPVQVAGGPLERDGTVRLAVTGQPYGRSVKLFDTRGGVRLNLVPFGSDYSGSIDLTVMRRPGQGQLVVATRSIGAQLVWYDAAGRQLDRQTIYATYRGGLELASGDIDGDGIDELIVSMSRGHEVRVYTWDRQRISAFSPLGRLWRGGFAVTTGDLEGDGNQEIIVTPRTGGGNAPVFLATMRGIVKKIWRLNTGAYRGEMDIQGLDVDRDGMDELLAVAKQGPAFLQQWTLEGKLEKQYNLMTDGRGASLGGLR